MLQPHLRFFLAGLNVGCFYAVSTLLNRVIIDYYPVSPIRSYLLFTLSPSLLLWMRHRSCQMQKPHAIPLGSTQSLCRSKGIPKDLSHYQDTIVFRLFFLATLNFIDVFKQIHYMVWYLTQIAPITSLWQSLFSLRTWLMKFWHTKTNPSFFFVLFSGGRAECWTNWSDACHFRYGGLSHLWHLVGQNKDIQVCIMLP